MLEESPPRYTVLDLFAGAGGLTEGFVGAGFEPVGAVEIDVAAAASYRANFGNHVYIGDIADYVQSARVPEVDVVIGGPPCQGFSNLGLRRRDDPRNGLWQLYAEVVRQAAPYAFVLENVDRFLTAAEFGRLRAACRRGGTLDGYRLAFHRQVNAADYGVPQRRIRTIVIGVARDIADVVEPEPTHSRSGDLPGWITVANALRRVPIPVDGIDLPESRECAVDLPHGKTVRVRGPFRTSELHLGRRPEPLSLARFAVIPPGGNWRDLPDELRAPCWQRRKTHGSGDVMGRLRLDEPSVTIRTEFNKPEKGRYLHPTADRAITHLEAALLMGFSRKHRWCGSKTEIARQIGNAVPPPLAAAVARSVRATLSGAGIERKRATRVA